MATATATPPRAVSVRRDTRLVSVSGVWIDTTWIDETLLEHCRRSAAGGFAFRVRSPEVASALVAAGFATRDADHPTALVGAGVDVQNSWDLPTPTSTAATAATAATEPSTPLGTCGSSHHLDPVEATVRGHRTLSAHAADGSEPVALCDRCADLMGSAGFFVAA